MARAAVPGRLIWQVATVKEARPETATARTLTLGVPGWPGHIPGQHVAVKLTAEDGYSAQRDYSIASAPEPGRLEITVQRLEDGEVSPYLAGIAEPGDQFELRGPIGGWFTWHPAGERPLLLIAGGSGVVPLMSMIRAHSPAASAAGGGDNGKPPVRLIYSARTPADVIYASELSERVRATALTATYLFTRANPAPDHLHDPAAGQAPAAGAHASPEPSAPVPDGGGAGATRAAGPAVRHGRITAETLAEAAFPPDAPPAVYVCGPSGFVETATTLLVAAGHSPHTIKTERFGPTS